MTYKEYYRNGKISKGLEITKADLFELKSKNDFISISEADLNNIKDIKDSNVIGVIMGDIGAIADGVNETIAIENPDCWFVYKPEKHGYIEVAELKNLTFGDAINLLKLGYNLAREGWNGKDMFLFLVPGSHFKVNRPPLLGIYPEGTEIDYQPHIDMKTAQDTVVPWLASQSDMLAEDYYIVL